MSEATSKEKCRMMVVKLVEMQLDDHYSGDGHKERCRGVLAADAFAHLKNRPHSEKINDFVAVLMQKIARDKWEARKEEVLSIIDTHVGNLIEEVLDDEEANEFYRFGVSPTGQKVFRNLDLMKNAISKGRNIMAAEIIRAWDDPFVAEQIDQYIESLDDDVDNQTA